MSAQPLAGQVLSMIAVAQGELRPGQMGLACFGDESFPSYARRVLWQFALHGRREWHAVGAARGVAIRNGFAILSASTTQPEPESFFDSEAVIDLAKAGERDPDRFSMSL